MEISQHRLHRLLENCGKISRQGRRPAYCYSCVIKMREGPDAGVWVSWRSCPSVAFRLTSLRLPQPSTVQGGRVRRGKHSLPASPKFTKIKTWYFLSFSVDVCLCGSVISLKHTCTLSLSYIHLPWEPKTQKVQWATHRELQPCRLFCQRFIKL